MAQLYESDPSTSSTPATATSVAESLEQQLARIHEAEKYAANWGDMTTIAVSHEFGFRRNLDVLAAAMGENVLMSQVHTERPGAAAA